MNRGILARIWLLLAKLPKAIPGKKIKTQYLATFGKFQPIFIKGGNQGH